MPASRSSKPAAKPARRSYGWLAAAGLVGAAIFLLCSLPASIVLRFLPKEVEAIDASGTLWHGSFANMSVRGRPAGALEWRLHPLALIRGVLSAEVHWVKLGFALDAAIQTHGTTIAAQDISGGGALEDLADLGMTRGWSSEVKVAIAEFSANAGKITAAAGTVQFAALKSNRFGDSDLGSYELSFPPEAVQGDGSARAQVRDSGGPVELSGSLDISPNQGLATFSGAIKERGMLADPLRQEFENLAQMRGRDPQGRVPLSIEFAL